MEGRKPMEMFVIPSPKRVAVIESEADIARSPEDVFRLLQRPANEPHGTFKPLIRRPRSPRERSRGS
jgi:hypothetical protein